MDSNKATLKKRWTPEEDQALRQIKENLRYKSWNIIAKKMANDYGFQGRSQKQCRDRYQNYLKTKDEAFQWTERQQAEMFKLFVREGSRWQLISTYFSNMQSQRQHRKGIHIKNKFYTRVRKAIRQVNAVIHFYFSKKYKPFQFSIISQLVSIISKNVEEAKYEKRQEMESQEEDEYARMLFLLIQLTNHDDYELFPQLRIKTCPQTEKKKLFKKLIKSLKGIEKQNPPSSINHSPKDISNISVAQAFQKPILNNQFLSIGENMKIHKFEKKTQCEYKIIENSQQKKTSYIRIISRIKKIKPITPKPQKYEEKESIEPLPQGNPSQDKKQQIEKLFGMQNKEQQYNCENFQPFNIFGQEYGAYYNNGMEVGNIQFFYNFQ